jgi:hypothetical protein
VTRTALNDLPAEDLVPTRRPCRPASAAGPHFDSQDRDTSGTAPGSSCFVRVNIADAPSLIKRFLHRPRLPSSPRKDEQPSEERVRRAAVAVTSRRLPPWRHRAKLAANALEGLWARPADQLVFATTHLGDRAAYGPRPDGWVAPGWRRSPFRDPADCGSCGRAIAQRPRRSEAVHDQPPLITEPTSR